MTAKKADTPAQQLPPDGAATWPLASELIASGPTPGPGARVARTASQAGGTVVLLELAQSFGWLGSSHWSAAQAAVRWPALTAAVGLAVSALHNLGNWRQGQKA